MILIEKGRKKKRIREKRKKIEKVIREAKDMKIRRVI